MAAISIPSSASPRTTTGNEFVAAPGSTARKARSTYRVVYPREAPGKAMVLSFAAFWAAPLALLVLALGAAIAAYRAYPG